MDFMFDQLFKNKNLSLFALIAVGFYVYTSIQDAEKTKLEIELLKRERDQGKVGDHNEYRCV